MVRYSRATSERGRLGLVLRLHVAVALRPASGFAWGAAFTGSCHLAFARGTFRNGGACWLYWIWKQERGLPGDLDWVRYARHTFAANRRSIAALGRLATHAAHMDLLCLSESATVCALRYGTSFLFYLDKWARAVRAARAPVPFDAACAAEFLSIE